MSWLGFLVVGGYLVVRLPQNRISWVLLGIGVFVPIGGISEWAADATGRTTFGILNSLGLVGFILLPLFLLWYPTGEAPSRRWIWLERSIFVLGAITFGYYLVRPGEIGITGQDNPIGIDAFAPLRDSSIEETAGFLLLLSGVLAFSSLIVRWRRGSGRESDQIRVVVFAGLLLAGLVLLTILLAAVFHIPGEGGFVSVASFVFGFNAIALAIAAAVVKYHLYDIGRIISRTFSYTLVVGLLAAVYLGAVSILQLFFRSDDPVIVAASTLAVAALFNPARRQIRRQVDRRFNRTSYSAETVIPEFAASLRDRVDLDGVITDWIRVVSETMQPATVRVWIKQAHQ